MSALARAKVHDQFLGGSCHVVVATIAFGMGIDKHDVRSVIHYGAPKSVEEYYQQVGRAGRDGLPSQCYLLWSDSDFTRYKDDFYTRQLDAEGKRRYFASLAAMQKFTAEQVACRRKSLLSYLGEQVHWSRCNACDNCVNFMENKGDLTRDFAESAVLVFRGFKKLPGAQSMSRLLPFVISEFQEHATKTGEKWIPGMTCTSSREFLKSLVGFLATNGYIDRSTQVAVWNGGKRTYEVLCLSSKAERVLMASVSHSSPMPAVELPVPQFVRAAEQHHKSKVAALQKELVEGGVNLATIPPAELRAGHGDILQAELWWVRTVKRWRQQQKAGMYLELLENIYAWRQKVSQAHSVAPTTILSNQLAKRIVYVGPDSKETLEEIGVRALGLDELKDVVHEWKKRHGLLECSDQAGGSASSRSAHMLLPSGMVHPPKVWKKYVRRQTKKGPKKATWELSYERFCGTEQESPAAIAISQPSGKKPIQEATVVRHLLTAFSYGMPLDLQRLVRQITDRAFAPPNKKEWEQVGLAFLQANISVLDENHATAQRSLMDRRGAVIVSCCFH